MVFAWRPAPVQIESILGHGYTSGMTAMDGFLADDVLAPPGTDALFSERIIRLPRIPLVYQPPAGMPAVTPLPALATGRISFGYFGRPDRLTDRTVAAWARILCEVPDSRLVLNSQAFQEAAYRDLVAARFAAHDIVRDRLKMVFTTPQPATWHGYGSIDIALDPFPHNAGTTTIEALWQGVPVVTRAGRPTVGRFGASILACVGLSDFVAQDDEGYVATAIRLASDKPALAVLRQGLRERTERSPLRDANGLARAVELAYRSLWRNWCQRAAATVAAA
jgi:predicted O-linked N-acetylglucosamine transferase (SPINDLY family)